MTNKETTVKVKSKNVRHYDRIKHTITHLIRSLTHDYTFHTFTDKLVCITSHLFIGKHVAGPAKMSMHLKAKLHHVFGFCLYT